MTRQHIARYSLLLAPLFAVFAAALLVAPDGGALAFVHRMFGQEPTLRLPVANSSAGEYALLVIFNGIGEEEFIVRME